MAHPLFITGSPRSGTSATARLMLAAGVDIGDELEPASDANPLGFYEDTTIVRLQRAMLAEALPDAERMRPNWLFAHRADHAKLAPFADGARALVRERDARGHPWGFKDPRTSMLLDFWDEVAPHARYVFVYRPVWEVVDSLMRLVHRDLSGRAREAVTAWSHYNTAILRFAARSPERCVLVHVAAVANAPAAVVERAAAIAGAQDTLRPPDTATFAPALLTTIPPDDTRAELVAAGFPDAVRIYEELEARADLGSTARDASRVRVVEAGRGSGALPVDVVGVGATVAPGAARTAVEVGIEPSAAAAANDAVAGTDAPVVAVVFGGALVDGAVEAAVGPVLDEPSVEAVLLLGGEAGPDGRATATTVDYGALIRADLDVRGIVVSRAAWQRSGGFDASLPAAALDAWALALAIAASGGGLRQVEAAVRGAAAPRDDAWATARRYAAARHGELLARDLLPASDALAVQVIERGNEAGELAKQVSELAKRLAGASAQRDAFEVQYLERGDEVGEFAKRLAEASAQRDELSERWAEACRQRDQLAEQLALRVHG